MGYMRLKAFPAVFRIREKTSKEAWWRATKGPMWGHPMLVLGALCPFLESICGHLSPKIDKVSEELTLRNPREGPWVGAAARTRGGLGPRQGLRTSIKSQFLKILIIFGDKCPRNGSKNVHPRPPDNATKGLLWVPTRCLRTLTV
jgi:hypothetical protein